jgi:hypothetical protein
LLLAEEKEMGEQNGIFIRRHCRRALTSSCARKNTFDTTPILIMSCRHRKQHACDADLFVALLAKNLTLVKTAKKQVFLI